MFGKNRLEVYNQKHQRLIDAAAGRIPDRVPVTALVETFALAYSGVTLKESQESMIKHLKGYKKIYEDVYFDCAFTPCMSHALNFGWALDSDVFFISDDGYTLQHKEYCPMTEDDYEALIENPLEWIINEFMPRRYPKLNASNAEQLKAFKKTLIPVIKFAGQLMLNTTYFKQVLQVPVMVGGSAEMPCDMPFDYLRGFKSTLTDIRRRPDIYEKAVNTLLDFCLDVMTMTHILMASPTSSPAWLLDNVIHSVIGSRRPRYKEFPWIFNPAHMPPFLSPEQFDRFYWPTYKAMVEFIHENGGKMFTLLEGNWGKNVDRLLELPDHSCVVMVENDNLADVKKRLENKFCVMGGMPLAMLRDSTVQECVDHAKKVVDEMAPGGNFIFCNDKVLLAPGDAQIKNLQAVNQFVHVYGQY
ncbi:MAG: hypothetical protein GX241_00545 [Ruminococcaceae bacterium]|nr:hypothetical protein [Oscillospiraceae bacterium]